MKFRIALLITVILVFSGCGQKEQAKTQGEQAIPVRVEEVELTDLNKLLEYVGSIKAQEEVNVYSKVGGKIIEKVKEEGMPVTKGEAIVYIDRDEVGLKFEKAPVESPLTGVIGRIYVDIGSTVLLGAGSVFSQSPIALVVNMDKVKINLDIPEGYLSKVFLGQAAEIKVDAYPDEKFIGKVVKLSPVVNTENRAAPIEISIDNPRHLLNSGMFAKVSLSIDERKQVPVILKEAILGKEPDAYVYIVEGKKAKTRKVTLGIHQGPLYEITQGLQGGELVVVMGQQRLHDNALVAAETGNGKGAQP